MTERFDFRKHLGPLRANLDLLHLLDRLFRGKQEQYVHTPFFEATLLDAQLGAFQP